MNHKTKGIVLKTVKYGETSVIVHIYTELFGIQSYLVNGVRSSTKKGAGKANLFQPGAILDLVIYHNELKNLQRLKEYKWHYLYRQILFDVVKNSVALFIIELVYKTVREPESNSNLYEFIEDSLIHLDQSEPDLIANYPLFFSLHLSSFFGFRFSDEYTETKQFLDLQEGEFVSEAPIHPNYIEGDLSEATSKLLRVMQVHELKEIKLHKQTRARLLQSYLLFYNLHFQDFGTMKTVPILKEIL